MPFYFLKIFITKEISAIVWLLGNNGKSFSYNAEKEGMFDTYFCSAFEGKLDDAVISQDDGGILSTSEMTRQGVEL